MALSDDNTRIGVIIPKELKEKAEKEAKKQDRSLSNYIVYILREKLEPNETSEK